MDNTKRIAWKCRRGMLELDLIFMRFYQEKFPQLTRDEQKIFELFLDEEDPLLASWLFGSAEPSNPDFVRLINQIIYKFLFMSL